MNRRKTRTRYRNSGEDGLTGPELGMGCSTDGDGWGNGLGGYGGDGCGGRGSGPWSPAVDANHHLDPKDP